MKVGEDLNRPGSAWPRGAAPGNWTSSLERGLTTEYTEYTDGGGEGPRTTDYGLRTTDYGPGSPGRGRGIMEGEHLQSHHDRLFKQTFGRVESAAAFFEAYLPAELAAAIDWQTLTPAAGSFVDETLRHQESDLLFST